MTGGELTEEHPSGGLSFDFWTFWGGQAISTLGSSFTGFALPLLIFQLTGSALNLSVSVAAAYLPSLFFGLLIGAWTDRLDRKQVMLTANLLLGAGVASVPIMGALGHLTIWWIYVMQFAVATLRLFFTSASLAAIPSLVPKDRLVVANGRIQASYSAMSIVGPLLAGSLSAFVPLSFLLLVDAGSYLVAAAAVLLIHRPFNMPGRRPYAGQSVRQDIAEGLRFVFGHPVLRNISLMMACVNFVSMTVPAQLVFFAKVHLHATTPQVGLLFSASAVGVFALSLLAGPLRRVWPFSRITLGLLEIQGFVTILMAQLHVFWAVLPLIALWQGLGTLFSINTTSLRQVITPNHLLGRVVATATVMGGAVIPLGSLLGGIAITRTGNVALVFTVIGVLVFLLPFAFSFTALGHADDYLAAAASHPRAAGAWVETRPRQPEAAPPGDGRGATGDGDLAAVQRGVQGVEEAARAISTLLADMVEAEPSLTSLHETLPRLTPLIGKLNGQWASVAAWLESVPRSEANEERTSVPPGGTPGRRGQ